MPILRAVKPQKKFNDKRRLESSPQQGRLKHLMRTLLHDFSYSIRSLKKTPAFTFVAIATLALGISATVIVFSIVDAVALQPLPYGNANRVVVLRWQDRNLQPQAEVSAPVFFMLKENALSFDSIAAVYSEDIGVNLVAARGARYVTALQVSESFFETIGTQPAIGRSFRAEEDRPGASGTVVLSYRLWQSIFDHDRNVLGQNIKINGDAFTIIGVMPEEFHSYPDADIWLPLQLNPANADPGSDYLVFASVKRGTLLSHAERELQALSQTHPLSYLPGAASKSAKLTLEGLQDFRTANIRHSLTILFGAVVLVLLIACTNLAVLLMVRGLDRTQEIAVRVALGSSKWRLAQIFLVESALLALTGGILGLVLAKDLLPLVFSISPVDISPGTTIEMNQQSIFFGLGVSALTACVLGLVPALRVAAGNFDDLLRQAHKGTTASLRQTRSTQLFVIAETSLTVVLLGVAVLLLQSFFRLQAVSPGFDPKQTWVSQASLAGARYMTTEATSNLFNKVAEHMRSIPGVESVAAIHGLPLETGLNFPVYPTDSPGKIDHAVQYRVITPDYFKTLRIRMLIGRSFTVEDDGHEQPMAIINESLARKWWPHESAIGHFVHAGEELGPELTDRTREIVGVVADVHEAGLAQNPPPVLFVPDQQVPDRITSFINKLFLASVIVRTQKGSNVSEQIRRAFESADPELPVASLRPMTQVLSKSLARPAFYAWLSSIFGIFAMLLTGIGLYGLLSYQVGLSVPEIGIRMALGANRGQIVGLIVKQCARLAFAGLLLGVIVSLFVSRLLTSMFYNLQHVFLTLLVGEAALLGLIAVLAGFLPATRASAIEPMAALRNQ
jgi:predicted permease